MKKYLFAGFITLLPIALTMMIIAWLLDYLTTPFLGLFEALLTGLGFDLQAHPFLLVVLSRLIVLILLFLLVLLLGFFGRKYFINSFMNFMQKLFLKIPFVKTVYRITNDVTKAVFSQKEKTFKRTVLVPFPNEDSHALGLVTGEVPDAIKKHCKEAELTVFVPTAPQPISGFLLLTPKKLTIDLDLSTEDTFKFLLSCGTRQPGLEDKEDKTL